MGVFSEIAFDCDRCEHCGHLLHQHIAGVCSSETLREYDDELHIVLVKRVKCSRCGHMTQIDYMGEPLSVRLEAIAENFVSAVPTV